MGVWKIYPFRYGNERIFAGCMFSHVGCWLSVRGKMSEVVRTCENESCPAGIQNVRERENFQRCRRYRYSCLVTSSKRKVYFCTGQNQKSTDVVETYGTWLLCPIRFLKLFNLPTPRYFSFRKKWILDSVFIIFSAPRGQCRTFKKIECKSYIYMNIVACMYLCTQMCAYSSIKIAKRVKDAGRF